MESTYLSAQESHHQHEGGPISLGSKEDLKPETAMGIWRLGLQDEVKIQAKKPNVQDGRIDEDYDHHIPKSTSKGKRGKCS